jgi:hypothetical protein
MSDNKQNSTKPATAEIVGGVYSTTPPAPVDGQGVPLQVDSTGNLKVSVSGGGSGANVNITGVNGNPPALSNPLPVELSDGTSALGTPSNPVRIDPTGGTAQPITASLLPLPTNAAQETGGNLATLAGTVASSKVNVNISSGTAAVTQSTSPWVTKDNADGTTGSTAPTTAIEIGAVDRSGNLQNVTADARGSANALAVEIVDASGNQITQFGSSTVTANQGTPAAVASAWPTKITDGTNVLGTQTNPLQADESLLGNMMAIMTQVLLELRSIRIMLQISATENGQAREADFDPYNGVETESISISN